MTATENTHNGSIVVSDIVDGYLVFKTYYGYSKEEALSMFSEEFIEV